MALEALEGMQNAIYNIYGEHVIDLKYAVEKADVAEQTITAIKEALAQPDQGEPVALTIYRGELCYKSQSDDQSFGMWCPVTQDLPFPEGTKFYTTPSQRKPLTDEEIAVLRALDNLHYWTERAVNKGNANLDIEEAMQQYNDALAAAHGIKE